MVVGLLPFYVGLDDQIYLSSYPYLTTYLIPTSHVDCPNPNGILRRVTSKINVQLMPGVWFSCSIDVGALWALAAWVKHSVCCWRACTFTMMAWKQYWSWNPWVVCACDILTNIACDNMFITESSEKYNLFRACAAFKSNKQQYFSWFRHCTC